MIYMSYCNVSWVVELGDEFEPEFDDLREDVRTEILAVDPPSAAIRAATGSAARRYVERLPPREYEGDAV